MGDGFGYSDFHGYGGRGSRDGEGSFGGDGSRAGATVRFGGGSYDGSSDGFGVGSHGAARFNGDGSYGRPNDRFSNGAGLDSPTTIRFGGGGPFGDSSGNFSDAGRAKERFRPEDHGVADRSPKAQKDRVGDVKSKLVEKSGEPRGNSEGRGPRPARRFGAQAARPDGGNGEGDGAGGRSDNGAVGFNYNVWLLSTQTVNHSALVNENTSPCGNKLNQTQSNGLKKSDKGQGRQIGTALVRFGPRARC
jgi:hypothetical protein